MPRGRAAYGHVRKPKTEIDGIKFASPGEAERYLELCIMKMQGAITDIVLQPVFELQPAFRKCCGRIWLQIDGNYEVNKKGVCPVCGEKMPVIRDMRYIADFKVTYHDGEVVIEDVKGWGGYTTPDFKMKKKMFEFRYPALTLTLLKRLGKQKVIAALIAERELLEKDYIAVCFHCEKCIAKNPPGVDECALSCAQCKCDACKSAGGVDHHSVPL